MTTDAIIIMPCSSPYPLGATLNSDGCNFSVYAPDHNNIFLALFDEDNQFQTYPLNNEYAVRIHDSTI